MVDAGLSDSQVGSFMTALNIPTMHHRNLKARERETGLAFEAVTSESCAKATEAECSAVR